MTFVWVLGLLVTSVTSGYLIGGQNVVFANQFFLNYFGSPSGVGLNLLASGLTIGGGFGLLFLNGGFKNLRDAVVWGSIDVVMGSVVQAYSKTYWMFFMSRVFCGVGNFIAASAAGELIAQLTTGDSVLPILLQGLWFLGIVLGSVCTYETGDHSSWMVPSLYQSVGPILSIVFTALVTPDSPKYLIKTGKNDQAKQLLATIHGDKSDQEFCKLQEQLKTEKIDGPLRAPKSGQLHCVLGAVVPFICVHFGFGIIMPLVGEKLELEHGIGLVPQAVLINGTLFLNSILTCIMRRCTQRSSNQLALLSAFVTSIIVSSVVYLELTQFPSALVLAAFVLTIALNSASDVVASTCPQYTDVSNIIAISGTLGWCYNGFVNPWSIDRAVWLRYSQTCLVAFFHLVLASLTTFQLRSPSLDSIEPHAYKN